MDMSYPSAAKSQSFWDRNPDLRRNSAAALVRRHSCSEVNAAKELSSKTVQGNPKCTFSSDEKMRYEDVCNAYRRLQSLQPATTPENGLAITNNNNKGDLPTHVTNTQLDESFKKAVSYLQTLTGTCPR